MKTYLPDVKKIERKWRLIDADGQVLGRLATRIATILRGKDKPAYTPFIDTGDPVIVINAAKVAVTGRKMENKVYYHHSQHPGGLKEVSLKDLLSKKPEEVIKKAVWGMLPKGTLGRSMFKKLKVYSGETHPHAAQQPEEVALSNKRSE